MGAAIHYNEFFVEDAIASYNEAYNETVQEYYAAAGLVSPYGGWFGNYPNGSYFCGTSGGSITRGFTIERCYGPSGALNVQPVISVLGENSGCNYN